MIISRYGIFLSGWRNLATRICLASAVSLKSYSASVFRGRTRVAHGILTYTRRLSNINLRHKTACF